MSDNGRLRQFLVSKGWIDEATAREIDAIAARSGQSFACITVSRSHLDEDKVLGALATVHGTPAVDLRKVVVAQNVVRRVPYEVARADRLFAVAQVDSNILLAMEQPSHPHVLHEIKFATGLEPRPYVALPFRIAQAVQSAYSSDEAAFRGLLAPKNAVPGQSALPLVAAASSAPSANTETGELAPAREMVFDAESLRSVPPVRSESSEALEVLVVEDDPDVLRLVQKTLEAMGFHVATATRGRQALEVLAVGNPSLVVLDAMLPEVHGFEICKRLKSSESFRNTKVLMMSAMYRGWRIIEDVKKNYQVDDFLEKPFRVAELRKKVAALMSQSKSGEAASELSSDARTLFQEGTKAYEKKNFEQALENFRRAEKLEPFSPQIHLMIAHSLVRTEAVFEAMYHYEKALELHPNLFVAAKNLASLYHKTGFAKKAVETVERAIACAPDDNTRQQLKAFLSKNAS